MAYSVANNQLLRKHFTEIQRIIDIPNLIDIQKNSYQRFLQADLPASARQNIGWRPCSARFSRLRISVRPVPWSTLSTHSERRSMTLMNVISVV